jgi:hypothetical protein
MLMVQISPTLILFSLQNCLQPGPETWWLLPSYGATRACHDLVQLIDVLSVTVQGFKIPIASQKTGGKYCKCNHIDQPMQLISVSEYPCITVNGY